MSLVSDGRRNLRRRRRNKTRTRRARRAPPPIEAPIAAWVPVERPLLDWEEVVEAFELEAPESEAPEVEEEVGCEEVAELDAVVAVDVDERAAELAPDADADAVAEGIYGCQYRNHAEQTSGQLTLTEEKAGLSIFEIVAKVMRW